MAVSKPLPGQQISPVSPWARGLYTVAVFNEGGGLRVANHAPQFQQIAGAGASIGWGGGKSGSAIKLNGSTARVRWEWPTASFLSGKVALAFRFKLNSSPGTNSWQIFGDDSNGAAGGLYVYFNGITTGRKLEFFVNGGTGAGGYTSRDFGSYVGQWFDVYCEWDGATGWRIEVDGVNDYTSFSTTGGRPNTSLVGRSLGCFYFSGAESRFADVSFEYFYHWEGRTFTAAEKAALRANPWQLWDEPQLVYAPVTTFTGTATSSQAQTAAATGLAGNIGTATSSQAQTAAATGLSGYIGTATASQAQTANATGLAGVIGNATSSQAQSATGAGAETYNGNATSSQAQTAAAVGLAGVIGTATASQAQTSDAIGVAGIVGTATSSQAQTVNGAGNNGQLSVQFGGHIAQPQYIHVPMFARGTGKATCKSKPHVRVLTRALAIGRSKGTCRPLVRQYMTGRAVGASVPVISSMRLQYNETWHAQRARDDQSLLFGF